MSLPPSARAYILSSLGAKWKGTVRHREASVLVKGTNRRVIVVRSPDPQLFEEAIFVLREDGKTPQDADLVLEQAGRAAGDYLKKCGVTTVRRRRRGPALLIALSVLLAGCVIAGAWYWFF